MTPTSPTHPREDGLGRGLLRFTLRYLALSSLSVLLFVAVVEIGLRLSGFRYVLMPEDIEFGRPGPVEIRVAFEPEDFLFWVTRDYPEKLARFARERPRLLFLGDSCTQLGRWDELVVRRIARERGEAPPWGNLAVAGWSTFQGRRQLERDVVPLAPRVVTLYYGWNDHWIGFGVDDRTVAQVRTVFSTRLAALRSAQLAVKATVAWRARETGFPERVALDDFRDNLASMVRTSRDHGIAPLLITAPSAHRRGAEPPELATRWLRELSDLVPLHQTYVAAVREVAAAEGVPLCDAAAHFASHDRETLEPLFFADGIHFTAAGDRVFGEVLFRCLERTGLLDELLTAPARTTP